MRARQRTKVLVPHRVQADARSGEQAAQVGERRVLDKLHARRDAKFDGEQAQRRHAHAVVVVAHAASEHESRALILRRADKGRKRTQLQRVILLRAAAACVRRRRKVPGEAAETDAHRNCAIDSSVSCRGSSGSCASA